MSEGDWEYLLNQMDDNSDWLLIGEWERFGLVWEWATKQEWWPKFVAQNGDYQLDEPAAGLKECGWVDTYIIDPTRFPKLITDFLREKGEKE